MDGIYNARAHARYLKALFELEELAPVKNMVDLGVGLGFLTLEMAKAFSPKKIVAIEPSEHAFKRAQKNLQTLKELTLKKMTIEEWCVAEKKNKTVYELGICSSVFQYLPSDSIKKVLPILSKKIKYLYLTVPTDLEQKMMKKDLDFVDSWAYTRSAEDYLEMLAPHFAVVSSRLLESKAFYSESTTPFTNLLYRF